MESSKVAIEQPVKLIDEHGNVTYSYEQQTDSVVDGSQTAISETINGLGVLEITMIVIAGALVVYLIVKALKTNSNNGRR